MNTFTFKITTEQAKLIEQVLKEFLRNNKKISRRNDICTDILNNNDFTSIITTIRFTEEFFTNEYKEVLLDVLNDSIKHIPSSDKKTEITKILTSNKLKTSVKKRKEQIKAIFHGYKTMNQSMKRNLQKLGIYISVTKTHYKAYYYNNNKYCIAISKTASDSNRSGQEISNYISHTML